jgi:hypothetical protein
LLGRLRIGRVVGNRAIIEGLRIDIVDIGGLNQRVIATARRPPQSELAKSRFVRSTPFFSIYAFERFSLRIARG